MKKSRKDDIVKMAAAIDDQPAPKSKKYPFEKGMDEIKRKTVDPRDISKGIKSADEIIATKKLEIPKCLQYPINGRIYVTSVAGEDMKTPAGLILPPTFKVQKNEQVEGVRRYFVVTWDHDGIPEEIQNKLSVAIEVYPFLPQDAIDFQLPRVIDWNTGTIFEVLHYTELAGISKIVPEEIKK